MRVGDVMSRRVITIGESDSCQEAVARMHRARARHLPVLGPAGRLVGIVTDRDVRHHLLKPRIYRELGTLPVDALLKAVSVSEIMSAPVMTVTPDEDLSAAAGMMLKEKLGSLPVVEDERVIGIVTETDLLRQICRAAACSPEVADIVVSYP